MDFPAFEDVLSRVEARIIKQDTGGVADWLHVTDSCYLIGWSQKTSAEPPPRSRSEWTLLIQTEISAGISAENPAVIADSMIRLGST